MKATCPSCSTSYRVAEEKVPDSGAQIKCPKCGSLFVVRKPPVTAPIEPSPPVHAQSTPLHALTGEPAPGEAPGARVPPVVTESARPARGVSAIRAQSGVKPQKQKISEAFRVRTQKGLIYDFSTRDAMVRWLKERNDLTGCEVAEGGSEWSPAHGFLDVPALDEAEAEAAAEPEPPARRVPAVRPAKVAAPAPAPRPYPAEAGVVVWVAVGLSTLLVILVAAATLTRYGVVDLSSFIPLEAVGVQFPGGTSAGGAVDQPPVAEAKNPEMVYQDAISQARQSIRSKRFSKAALEYNRALSIRPDSVEALEGLARAYNGLGDRDRAEAVLKKAQSTKGD